MPAIAERWNRSGNGISLRNVQNVFFRRTCSANILVCIKQNIVVAQFVLFAQTTLPTWNTFRLYFVTAK